MRLVDLLLGNAAIVLSGIGTLAGSSSRALPVNVLLDPNKVIVTREDAGVVDGIESQGVAGARELEYGETE